MVVEAVQDLVKIIINMMHQEVRKPRYFAYRTAEELHAVEETVWIAISSQKHAESVDGRCAKSVLGDDDGGDGEVNDKL
jgi:hypothetical protein